jgi:hypothetical protein
MPSSPAPKPPTLKLSATSTAFGRDDEARPVDALRAGGYARGSLVAEDDGPLSITATNG